LAAVQLQKLGYSSVVSMAGGFDAWSVEGRPADKPVPVSFE
jgi:rhodanese-related sulfurtransferase